MLSGLLRDCGISMGLIIRRTTVITHMYQNLSIVLNHCCLRLFNGGRPNQVKNVEPFHLVLSREVMRKSGGATQDRFPVVSVELGSSTAGGPDEKRRMR